MRLPLRQLLAHAALASAVGCCRSLNTAKMDAGCACSCRSMIESSRESERCESSVASSASAAAGASFSLDGSMTMMLASGGSVKSPHVILFISVKSLRLPLPLVSAYAS